MTDEDARKVMNAIIPDMMIQTGHHSPDEHPLAGCDHLADTKTLKARGNTTTTRNERISASQ
jgi:hypothetical protein